MILIKNHNAVAFNFALHINNNLSIFKGHCLLMIKWS